MTTTTVTIKTRSGAKFALVKVHFAKGEMIVKNGRAVGFEKTFTGASIVGYAHSASTTVLARCRRVGARLVAIEGGKVTVEVEA
jgi:hypothetical protein